MPYNSDYQSKMTGGRPSAICGAAFCSRIVKKRIHWNRFLFCYQDMCSGIENKQFQIHQKHNSFMWICDQCFISRRTSPNTRDQHHAGASKKRIKWRTRNQSEHATKCSSLETCESNPEFKMNRKMKVKSTAKPVGPGVYGPHQAVQLTYGRSLILRCLPECLKISIQRLYASIPREASRYGALKARFGTWRS